MKKATLGLVLAMMLAVLPVSLFATSAVAAGNSPVRVAYTDGTNAANIIVDGVVTAGVAPGNGFDTTLGTGLHTVVACPNTAASYDGTNCKNAGGTSLGAPQVGSSNNVNLPNENSSYIIVVNTLNFGGPFTPSVLAFENDLTKTGLGEARFQLNNAAWGPVSVCIDSHDGDGLVPGPTNVSQNGDQDSAVLTAVQGAEVYVGSASSACSTYSHFTVDLPAGVAFILTATNSGSSVGTPACGAACTQVILVGQGTVPNDPDTVAFCAAILNGPDSLSGFGPALKTLVGNVDPTNATTIKNTQPNPAAQMAFVNTYTAVFDAGDASVPASIKDSWVTLTSGARKLLTTFQLVGYDMSKLPVAAVKDIVLGANGIKLPGVPADPDVVAATADLTAFVTGTCLASSGGGGGTTEPPAATPVAAAARFTG